jgi:RNA polymerase sigma-70 factor, ECF subfamily
MCRVRLLPSRYLSFYFSAMNAPSLPEITLLLRAWSLGEDRALEELTSLVYQELYRSAQRQMAKEKAGHVLQNTALINELYLRLAKLQGFEWQDRSHFFAVCAKLMRQILIDYARSHKYLKRGAGAQHVPLNEAVAAAPSSEIEMVALDRALQRLAEIDERMVRVVELRFFGGLSVEETAQALKVSPDTVKRDWKFAKHWLLCELSDPNAHGL